MEERATEDMSKEQPIRIELCRDYIFGLNIPEKIGPSTAPVVFPRTCNGIRRPRSEVVMLIPECWK